MKWLAVPWLTIACSLGVIASQFGGAWNPYWHGPLAGSIMLALISSGLLSWRHINAFSLDAAVMLIGVAGCAYLWNALGDGPVLLGALLFLPALALIIAGLSTALNRLLALAVYKHH